MPFPRLLEQRATRTQPRRLGAPRALQAQIGSLRQEVQDVRAALATALPPCTKCGQVFAAVNPSSWDGVVTCGGVAGVGPTY